MSELSRRGFFGAVSSVLVVGNPPAGGEMYRALAARIDTAAELLQEHALRYSARTFGRTIPISAELIDGETD